MTLSDDGLIGRLRAVAAHADPVPPDVTTAATAVFDLRTLDAELADLVADSLDTAGHVRGPAAVRLLSYESHGVTVELEVTETGTSRTLLGEVTGTRGAVHLDVPGRTQELDVDEDGRFQVADVPAGQVRLRCTAEDGGSLVATVWTRI